MAKVNFLLQLLKKGRQTRRLGKKAERGRLFTLRQAEELSRWGRKVIFSFY